LRTQAATTWNSASVLDVDFDYFADDLRPFLTESARRPAMWVGISRYDRVAFFLSGIMMTRGRGEDGRFREWLIADIRARTGYGSPVGWELIIMQERFADLTPSPSQAPHPDVLDPEQNQEAIGYLCRRLTQFLDAEEAASGHKL
jgi:hypothetical protein